MGNKLWSCCQSDTKPLSDSKHDDGDKRRLEETDFSSLNYFSFKGQIRLAKVTRVIDADTVDIVHYVDGKPRKDSLRLSGFDAPEKRPKKSSPHCELEKKAALAATEVLIKLLFRGNNIIIVHFEKAEKYGRQLGEVFIEIGTRRLEIKQWMLEQKIVKPYSGKKKEEWTERELEYIVQKKDLILQSCENL